MKLYRGIENVSVALVVLGLVFLYSLGYLAYQNYGFWPSYNNPQSWNSQPASILYGRLFLFLLFCAALSFIGIVAQIIKVVAGRLYPAMQVDYLKLAVMSAIYLVYLIDPVGLLYWYLD